MCFGFLPLKINDCDLKKDKTYYLLIDSIKEKFKPSIWNYTPKVKVRKGEQREWFRMILKKQMLKGRGKKWCFIGLLSKTHSPTIVGKSCCKKTINSVDMKLIIYSEASKFLIIKEE